LIVSFYSIFVPYLSSDKLKLFDCSLSQISLIIFLYSLFHSSIFSSIFQAINIFFNKRKVLGQSFKIRLFRSKVCKGASKIQEQKSKAKN